MIILSPRCRMSDSENFWSKFMVFRKKRLARFRTEQICPANSARGAAVIATEHWEQIHRNNLKLRDGIPSSPFILAKMYKIQSRCQYHFPKNTIGISTDGPHSPIWLAWVRAGRHGARYRDRRDQLWCFMHLSTLVHACLLIPCTGLRLQRGQHRNGLAKRYLALRH